MLQSAGPDLWKSAGLGVAKTPWLLALACGNLLGLAGNSLLALACCRHTLALLLWPCRCVDSTCRNKLLGGAFMHMTMRSEASQVRGREGGRGDASMAHNLKPELRSGG